MVYNLFLPLLFAVGLASTTLNLSEGNKTTWDSPKSAGAHPEVYKRANGRQNYDPAKVIKAMGQIDNGLKILTAHRGIYGPGCPENSKCSILATVQAGIESVEIDVYSDQNGALWPLHDKRIGRAIYYVPLYSRLFNPYHDAPSGINNPLLSDMATKSIDFRYLRDINGKITENYKLENLEAILRYVKQLGVLAVVLDMRKMEEILTVVKLIQDLNMTDITAIKVQVLVIPPLESIISTLGGVRIIPVQYPGPAEVIVHDYHVNHTTKESTVTLYDLEYKTFDNFLYFEPSTKMFDYTSTYGWEPAGPMAFVQKTLNMYETPMGTYILTPNVAQGYFDPDGHCCGQPNDWLYNSSVFGDETRDDRSKAEVMVQIFNVLTCDNILPILDLATKYGYRTNISKILK